jgi:hypothetical protein
MSTSTKEGPVTKALRIAGVSMVCGTHADGSTEFGYPLAFGDYKSVRFSTGVVRPDGTTCKPTSKVWLVADDGSSSPLSADIVRSWDAATAWKHRGALITSDKDLRRNPHKRTFTLPCDVSAEFILDNTRRPISIRYL